MRKILVILTIFSLVSFTNAWSQAGLDKKLQDALGNLLEPNVDVIVRFKKQNSVAQLVSEIKKSTTDQQEIGQRLKEALGQRADQDQKSVKDVVERLKGQGKVKKTGEKFWLVNAVSMTVDKKALRELQNHPDVEKIELDAVQVLIEPERVRKEDSRNLGKGKPQEIKPGQESASTLATTGPVPSFSAFNFYNKQTTESDKVHLLTVNGVPIKGAGIRVAVLDTGVDAAHPEFRAGQVVPGASFISAEPSSTQDLNGHGTHCAGTVGSRSFGMAPDCTIVAVKVLAGSGSGSFSGIAQGVQFCVNQGVKVVSMSLGGPDSTGTDFVEQNIKNAITAGLVCVIAGGNEGPTTRTIGSPGSTPECITVGAVNQLGTVADFSSRGPTLDNIAKPDIAAPGVSILSTTPGGQTAFFSGTSMATPCVAGIVALMLQAKSAQTPAQVKQVLLSTTTGVDTVNVTGRGVVNALKSINVVLPPAPAPTPQPPADAFTQNKLISDLSRELGVIFGSKVSSFRFFLAETPVITQSTRTAIVRLRIQNLVRGTITTVRVDMVLQLVGSVFNWVVTAQSRTLLQGIAAQG